jgi:hypothetical protein
MDRRKFVALTGASLPLLVSSLALSQEHQPVNISPEQLLALAVNPPEFYLMVAEMDACWISLVEGNPSATVDSVANARKAYLQYRAQLNPDNLNRIVATLKNTDWMATAEKLLSELEPVLARVRQQLIQNGINESSRLIVVFLRAFNGFTQSLVALSPDNDHWYCHCYGLELLCK